MGVPDGTELLADFRLPDGHVSFPDVYGDKALMVLDEARILTRFSQDKQPGHGRVTQKEEGGYEQGKIRKGL
jgi:hypothetical protein